MLSRFTDFFAPWFRSWPWRLRQLAGPYFIVLGGFLVSYAGLTALLRPWVLGRWWSIGVPVVAGFGVCWWLWHPWAALARNGKGETRRLPLMLVWLLVIAAGWHTYQYVHYRLGEVREVREVRGLAQPGAAFFFQLRGPFHVSRALVGRYAFSKKSKEKSGALRYSATCCYACPLLANAADTVLVPPAWLSYSYEGHLGSNLTAGELDWRYQNFVARSDARFDALNLQDFAYLVRAEHPGTDSYRAVRASPLAPADATPLLLLPVRTPFAARGNDSLRWLSYLSLGGSALVVMLLLVMPLRPGAAATA